MKLRFMASGWQTGALLVTLMLSCSVAQSQGPQSQAPQTREQPQQSSPSQAIASPAAGQLLEQVLQRLAYGQAFDAKVRQRVWAAGREVIGVGSYEQAGNATGAYLLQVTIHDGAGTHTLQQMSDGRLAYTRSEIADEVSLTRVDVGWLDEAAKSLGQRQRIKPSMRVGGPAEMLDLIRRDYDLRLGVSQIDGRNFHVVLGSLKRERREAVLAERPDGKLPSLYPTHVNVFVTAEDDPKTGIAKGIPIRIEHRGDPNPALAGVQVPEAAKNKKNINSGRLISLIELYSIRPMPKVPPIQHFRFENQDASVTFVNETNRYANQFGLRIAELDQTRFR